MSEAKLKLYHYWRSSSSWRVRLALDYKKIPFEAIPVNLLNGESESEAHLKRSPAGFVPVLELADGTCLTESLAIIRYLEETHPKSPSLLPGSPIDRAKIWSFAEVVNSGTQPIQNIPVMALHSSDPAEQKKWAQHWIKNGLQTLEVLAKKDAGEFCYQDSFTLADACLLPQIYNAERYEVDVKAYPTLSRVRANTEALPCFMSSHPDSYKPLDFKG